MRDGLRVELAELVDKHHHEQSGRLKDDPSLSCGDTESPSSSHVTAVRGVEAWESNVDEDGDGVERPERQGVQSSIFIVDYVLFGAMFLHGGKWVGSGDRISSIPASIAAVIAQ